MSLTEQIKQKALELGFDVAGITDASPVRRSQVNRLIAWLDAGYAGQMTYMHRNLDKRTNPARLLPGAESVIVVGLNYKPPVRHRPETSRDAIRNTQSEAKGRVAPYACYQDYHSFIKKRLRKLADFLVAQSGPGLRFKICVDSAPLLERALAVRAGLGFIGKNHMLVNPRLGPQILLGEIVTNLDLKSEIINHKSEIDSACDSCNECISACPTGALRPDGRFDATKCISYLTIECKSEIPAELARKIGGNLFGCSECILACPHYQKAPTCASRDFIFSSGRSELDLNEILRLTEEQFQRRFAESSFLRPGLAKLKQTAQICLENLVSSGV